MHAESHFDLCSETTKRDFHRQLPMLQKPEASPLHMLQVFRNGQDIGRTQMYEDNLWDGSQCLWGTARRAPQGFAAGAGLQGSTASSTPEHKAKVPGCAGPAE